MMSCLHTIRGPVVALLMALPWMVASGGARAADTGAGVRAVYHIDDSARAVSAMRSMTNHLKAAPGTRIVVVTLSDGVDFLLGGAKDARGNPYEPMIDDLILAGVEFRACNNTLVGRRIERGRLHPEVSIVESGVAEIARLQAVEGFAYVKP
jgi:uncharacterized protein